ncbi:hypothetical protein B5807_09094 [Epicoccum nigrum]|uniref:Uncharacterized protein n=1 Tax=Epicoccum nigrum TaxID=105696 RepID=A0A1Y2LMY5_EPING|nr:hypothetical protein B5807_09094 [Epicoccum nigrum]
MRLAPAQCCGSAGQNCIPVSPHHKQHPRAPAHHAVLTEHRIPLALHGSTRLPSRPSPLAACLRASRPAPPRRHDGAFAHPRDSAPTDVPPAHVPAHRRGDHHLPASYQQSLWAVRAARHHHGRLDRRLPAVHVHLLDPRAVRDMLPLPPHPPAIAVRDGAARPPLRPRQRRQRPLHRLLRHRLVLHPGLPPRRVRHPRPAGHEGHGGLHVAQAQRLGRRRGRLAHRRPDRRAERHRGRRPAGWDPRRGRRPGQRRLPEQQHHEHLADRGLLGAARLLRLRPAGLRPPVPALPHGVPRRHSGVGQLQHHHHADHRRRPGREPLPGRQAAGRRLEGQARPRDAQRRPQVLARRRRGQRVAGIRGRQVQEEHAARAARGVQRAREEAQERHRPACAPAGESADCPVESDVYEGRDCVRCQVCSVQCAVCKSWSVGCLLRRPGLLPNDYLIWPALAWAG